MKNFKESVDDRIQDIMDTFDFDRVHKVMHDTNWMWSGRGIPTVTGLRQTAEKLLNDVVNSRSRYISTGGLTVTLYRTDTWFDLNLSFVVTDCSVDGIFYTDDTSTHKKHKIKMS